jgi:hypothetical protein
MNSKEIISNIRDIFKKFPVPINLQRHLFKVTAVGEVIADHWKGPALDRDELVAFMLLHDIGNLVKYDFNHKLYDGDIGSDIEGWKKKQKETIAKYGEDDLKATIAFAKELNVSSRMIELLEESHFHRLRQTLESSDWVLKIGKYSDMRAAPQGIVSVDRRFDDLEKRYIGRQIRLSLQDFEEHRKLALELEKQIFENTDITPEQVDEKAIQKYVDSY